MAAFAISDLPPRKIIGAVAVLALHLLALALLMRATLLPAHMAQPQHEPILWFVLPQKPKPHIVEQRKPPAHGQKLRVIPIPQSAPPSAIASPPAANAPPLTGLHGLLFDCAPENLANLSPEERAKCATSSLAPKYDDSKVDYADHTNRSHAAALWARGRARKNAPLLLPCASPVSVLATASLATLYCLGKAALTGKLDLDNQPGYDDPAAKKTPPVRADSGDIPDPTPPPPPG